jgi:hypothetical protein
VGAKKANSSQRVTQVDPWIFGGDGRLVDLFPFPPWLILLGRFISACLRHPIRSSIVILTIYAYTQGMEWWALLIPPLIYFVIATLFILKHWYYSPDVPLIRWKRN